MSVTVKLLLAALIGAGVIAGGGAFYVFVIAPPAVHQAIIPSSYKYTGTPAQQDNDMKAQCQAIAKEGGAPLPVCKQILSGKSTKYGPR